MVKDTTLVVFIKNAFWLNKQLLCEIEDPDRLINNNNIIENVINQSIMAVR